MTKIRGLKLMGPIEQTLSPSLPTRHSEPFLLNIYAFIHWHSHGWNLISDSRLRPFYPSGFDLSAIKDMWAQVDEPTSAAAWMIGLFRRKYLSHIGSGGCNSTNTLMNMMAFGHSKGDYSAGGHSESLWSHKRFHSLPPKKALYRCSACSSSNWYADWYQFSISPSFIYWNIVLLFQVVLAC